MNPTAPQELAALLDGVNDGVLAFDGDWRFTYVNANGARLLGRTRESLLGSELWAEFPELKESVFGRAYLRAVADKLPETVEGFYPPLGAWFEARTFPSSSGLVLFFRDVTERHLFQRTLLESEQRFRLMAQAVPEVLWIAQPDGGIEFFNARWYQLTGGTPESSLGQGWRDYLHPDDAAALTLVWNAVNADARPYEFECRYRRADGEYRWFIARAFPQLDAHDRPIRWYGASTDITEHRRATEQLQLSEQRYRTFISQSTEGIYRVEANPPVDTRLPVEEQLDRMLRCGVLAECNDAMARMYGFSRADELYGTRLDQMMPPEDPKNREYLTAFVQSGYRLEGAESRELDRDGRPHIFQNSLVGVVEDGKLLRAWGTQRDITSEVEGRALLEQLTAALAESEGQLRELVENLPDLAWSATPDGRVDYYNHRWYEYTGTTFAQMQDWGWQQVHHPEVLPDVLARWRHCIATGEPLEMEFPLRSQDGQYRWFLTRVRPLRRADGTLVRWFGTSTDVDERRRQASELEEAIRLRDEFLSIASHELKTPLTPLGLRLEGLARELERQPPGPFVDSVRRYLDTGRRQVRKLNELVGDLLDVSRISAGRMTLTWERVELTGLLREVVHRFEPEALRAGSALSVHADGEVVGEWDRLRLEQVAENLISNAVKYGAGGAIDVSLKADGADAVLTVKDQGIGIDPESQRRIFERFERAVSVRHYGGLGLGLYITRTIVNALGGEIRVESAVGAGSTFEVRLPRARATSAA